MTDTSLTWWQWLIVGLFLLSGMTRPAATTAGWLGGIFGSVLFPWLLFRGLNATIWSDDEAAARDEAEPSGGEIHEEW